MEELPYDTISGFGSPIVKKKRIDLGLFIIDSIGQRTSLTDPNFLLELKPKMRYEYIFTFEGLEDFLLKRAVGPSTVSQLRLVVNYKNPEDHLTSSTPLREHIFYKLLK